MSHDKTDLESLYIHDDWPAYQKLDEQGYSHGTVTHKYEFKSKDGVCTNLIQGILKHLQFLLSPHMICD